jgi:hypothetical protein
MLIQGRTAAIGFIIASFILSFSASFTVQAESKLNFPRLSAEANTFTGIAIVNPSATDAVVTFTAFGADGQPVPGALVPAPLTIKAGEQLPPKLTSDLFGTDLDPATVGWFQATSPTDGLVGFFLFLNFPTTVFDGADVPASFDKLDFVQVRIDSDYTTELNIINPNATAAEMELKLLGGASTATRPQSIPAMGAVRLDVQDFFGIATPSASDQYVTVTSDVKVAGFEFVRAPTGDLVGLGARNGDEKLSQLYFPQVAVFGGFETSLGVVNNSSSAVVLDIRFFDPSGVLVADATAPLNPGSILVEDLAALLSLTGTDLLQGWLKVESTLPAITGFLTYAIPDSGSAATVTPASLGLSEVIFSHLATGEGFFTGVALLNPGQLAANVRIMAMEETGSAVILGSTNTLLRPGERISKLITELAVDAGDKVKGFIFFRSNLPIYSSSLFGSATVLANIPPQLSPESFAPDAGLDPVTVTPPLAILQPSTTQSFQVEGITGEVTWLVNDVEGGNSSIGTIDDAGQYTAPIQVPLPRVVTVSAQGGLQKGGSSVDVLKKEQIFASTEFVVQSVVYLGSLQNLYSAELAILSSAGEGSAPQATTPSQISNNSEIFEIVSGNVRTSIKSFDDEKVTKIISFTASSGKEFLLLAAQTSGKVIRLDPANGDTFEVATGLDQPTALVLDSSTGDLLVAEQDKVTIIPKILVEFDLVTSRLPGAPGPQAATFPLGGGGLARDRCTGDLYTSDTAAGVVRRFNAETQQVSIIFSGLDEPGQLLALYRTGVSCPHSLQLLVVEVGARRVTLLSPALDLQVPWVSNIDATEVAFLPEGTSFGSTQVEGILVTELLDAEEPQAGEGGSRLNLFDVPGLYDDLPDNEASDNDTTIIFFADSGLEACAKSALNLSPTQFVTLGGAKTITQLDCSSRQISLLDGLEAFADLTDFVAQNNVIIRDEALANLDKLTKLDLKNNKFSSSRLDIVAGLVNLKELDVCGQLFPSPFGDVAGIDNLEFVQGLVNLEIFRACDGVVRELDLLSGLIELQELDLENNRIIDLSPLFDNPGLGTGDTLKIRGNNLNTDDCADIATLTSRGVTVEHDVTCP